MICNLTLSSTKHALRIYRIARLQFTQKLLPLGDPSMAEKTKCRVHAEC